jgi:hypothetical protein
MKDWDPKSLWDELRRTLQGWMNEDEEQSSDPTLLFHMMVTAPLVIGLLIMVSRG